MTVNKWTASQIARKVIDNNELFILDVRNTDVFADWKIEGHMIAGTAIKIWMDYLT